VVILPDKLAKFSSLSAQALRGLKKKQKRTRRSIPSYVTIGPQCVQTASHTNTENVEKLPPLPHDLCFVFAFEGLQHSKLSLLLS